MFWISHSFCYNNSVWQLSIWVTKCEQTTIKQEILKSLKLCQKLSFEGIQVYPIPRMMLLRKSTFNRVVKFNSTISEKRRSFDSFNGYFQDAVRLIETVLIVGTLNLEWYFRGVGSVWAEDTCPLIFWENWIIRDKCHPFFIPKCQLDSAREFPLWKMFVPTHFSLLPTPLYLYFELEWIDLWYFLIFRERFKAEDNIKGNSSYQFWKFWRWNCFWPRNCRSFISNFWCFWKKFT